MEPSSTSLEDLLGRAPANPALAADPSSPYHPSPWDDEDPDKTLDPLKRTDATTSSTDVTASTDPLNLLTLADANETLNKQTGNNDDELVSSSLKQAGCLPRGDYPGKNTISSKVINRKDGGSNVNQKAIFCRVFDDERRDNLSSVVSRSDISGPDLI